MTLTALEKVALDLPEKQRVKLANALFASLPPHREALSFTEMERRADAALSGTAEMIPAQEFHAGVRDLIIAKTQDRLKSQTRSIQRG